MIVKVPETAIENKDQSNCGEDKQFLNLSWQESAQNQTGTVLRRNVTVIFEKKTNET